MAPSAGPGDDADGGGGHRAPSGGFPWAKVLVIGSTLFVNQFGSLVVFPIIPWMVKHFYPSLSDEELGPKAGLLASAFHVGGLVASIVWGKLSDAYGRKLILQTGIIGTLVSMMGFGLSTNYTAALLVRFAWGALNGNIGVGKAMLAEICTDEQMSKCFSIIGISSGLGRLVGPAAGAFLAEPAKQYPSVFGGNVFFETYPFFLPCALAGVVCVVSFIFAHFYLEETLHLVRPGNKKSWKDTDKGSDGSLEALLAPASADGAAVASSAPAPSTSLPRWMSPHMRAGLRAKMLAGGGDDTSSSAAPPLRPLASLRPPADALHPHHHHHPPFDSQHAGADCEAPAAPPDGGFWASLREMWELLFDLRIRVSILMYGGLAFIGIITNEVFPLWALTDARHGGFSFTANDIGMVMVYYAPAQILAQILLFPILAQRLGYRRLFLFSVLVYSIGMFLMPFASKLNQAHSASASLAVVEPDAAAGLSASHPANAHHNATQPPTAQTGSDNIGMDVWLLLLALYVLGNVGQILAFTVCMVVVNNSSMPMTRGTVNGLAQTTASLARAVGPAIGGVAFALSVANGAASLTWYTIGILGFGLAFYSLRLPPSIDQKRE